MSEVAANRAIPAASNRVLSVFAGLAPLTLFAVIDGTMMSFFGGLGILQGLDPEAAARVMGNLRLIAFGLAALGTVAVGWWLRKQGSVLWGVAILAVAGIADALARTATWLRAMEQAQGDNLMGGGPIIIGGVSVSYFPAMVPVAVLVFLVLLGAGAQKLRSRRAQ
ncbi:MAG: hypothetical protein VX529_08045 [Pseudomonadota bacterium]|nr:hypothetical protein [Pseudomonadota bacterium]